MAGPLEDLVPSQEGVVFIEIGIRSFGSYVPDKRLTNADLEKMVETSDDWIISRTGIRERRVAGPEIPTSLMATRAAEGALQGAGLTGKSLRFVISSTVTPELTCPCQAALVSQALSVKSGFCFDLNAACSGWLYGLTVGSSLLRTAGGGHGLVTASEKMTSMTNYADRSTCVLFGDGAGAAILTSEPPYHRILDARLGSDPAGADLVTMGGQEAHGTQAKHYFWQEGKGVFRFVVTLLKDLIPRMLDCAGLSMRDRFHIVPHQANLRMAENIARELGIPLERFVTNIQTRGNTSSASIGIAMAEAAAENRFESGDKILLVAFGGGLTWAAMTLEW